MFYLKRNLSATERSVRIALGICIVIVTATLVPMLWGQIAGYVIAITLMGTAIVGFCPAYALFGKKTK